jgi:arylformamidase
MKKLWDISPPVHAGSPVFPGDTPYTQEWVATLGPGCPVNVSALRMSPHVGAHADAPLHYDPEGAAIGAVSLAPFLGPCRVIHAIGCGPLVACPSMCNTPWPDCPPRAAGAHLRTHAAHTGSTALCSAYAPATVRTPGRPWAWCSSASTPPASTPPSSKTLDSHQVIRRRDMRVLENLVLDDVPEGDYELIALPLKLAHLPMPARCGLCCANLRDLIPTENNR